MADNLERYRAKRDFKITSEPAGGKAGKPKKAGGVFVVHKHDATRLHYDLRLEHDGVLWSWAVTRGPSLDPEEKRLAVHVEDHPFDYRKFEGNIPAGQYGAGAVIIWDEGSWHPEGDPAFGMKKGHLKFELKGAKLNGDWHLVRLKPRAGEKRDNWLLIKSDDAFARKDGDILEEAPESVKSGMTVEEVAAGGTAPGKPRASAKAQPGTAKRKRAKAAHKSGAPLPDFVTPCLARLQQAPPAGDDWLHEVKFDGYRVQARIEDGKVRLLTRTGLDWTQRFGKTISGALAALPVNRALVDGEIVVLADSGISVFSELQLALSEGRSERMVFYAFDIINCDGDDLTATPLIERKERLSDLFAGINPDGPLRLSEHFVESGPVMLDHACRMGLEGIISKRADAPYRSGRGNDWIKSKCTLRQEFVIAGYLPSDKAARGLRSLIVGYHGDDGALKPAGHVGTGFSSAGIGDLQRKLDSLKAAKAPFTGPAAGEKGAVWVRPELVAEIEFRSWTRGGSIRHASFQGLREDKPAGEVVVEEPEDKEKPRRRSKAAGKAPARPKAKAKAGAAPDTSIVLSSPDKKLWPDEGITKQMLLDHYKAVWPRMSQFVVCRPLALVRAPDGIDGQRFFQKHSMPGMHKSILKSHDPEDNEEVLYIEDFDGLAALVQLGVVEIHIWGSTIDRIGEPDQIVFDLDPDEGLDVEDVRRAALEIKEKLDDLDLPNFVKTSGGKGFHVVVPLKPKADWTAVKTFAHDFAQAMAELAPERYTATLSKKARKGRIFIDYLRNGRGSTTVAPYSSRAKKGATVSMPITWEMVADGADPTDYAIGEKATLDRLDAADPWANFFASGRPLDRR